MLKKGGLVWMIWNIALGVIFAVFGIVTIANFNNVDFQNVIIRIAGILVIIDAALRLLTQVIGIINVNERLSFIKTDWGSAVVGASELAVGVMLILVSCGDSAYLLGLLEYLTKFIGILLIVAGSIALVYSIVFLVKKAYTVPINVLILVSGMLVITGGILVLVFSTPEALLQAFFVIFGVLFILVGLLLIVGSIIVAVQVKKAAKLAKEGNVEAEDAVDNAESAETSDEEPESKE